jgi:hypothetical protein
MTHGATHRQLAHRANDGIEVSLYWHEPTNQVTVEIFDVSLEEVLAFEVEAGDALDAFHHPYVYASAREAYWLAAVPATAAA